ncbi:hypothetical protein [uncultured Thiothrix sp.]|uniref:hypothetical protein n=1 Tax=uncultured Thiothrix sp. TaxID=223185 RepID=UPI00260A336E|nr:hypothetical protein [uncultured Thiothrix sp.]
MARKKKDDSLGLIIIGALIAAWQWFVHNINLALMIAGGFLALFIAFKVITALLKKKRYNERRAYLMQKYRNNTELVDMIMDGQFWKQQTADQLLDSLGTPVAVDKEVQRNKRREVWKYDHVRTDQYLLRITLDNDLVTGWTQRT